jgi:hypothetical protein
MTPTFFDRLLTPRTLIVLNLAIIVLTETLGRGVAFEKYGLIHAVAILFAILVFTRMARRWAVADREIRGFIVDSMFAMVFFAFSHLIEFVGFSIVGLSPDQAYAAVNNCYAVSLLFLIMGSEYVMKNYHRSSTLRIWLSAIGAGMLIGMTIGTLIQPPAISFSAGEFWPYLYLGIIALVTAYALKRMRLIAHLYGWLTPFINTLRLAIVMIVSAAILDIFHGTLSSVIPDYQIDYLSHFIFYIGLSIMLLAYGEPLQVGGIHADVRRDFEDLKREAELANLS